MAPPPARCEGKRGRRRLHRRYFMTDGPQECRHFAGDRRHDHRQLFARGAEPAIAGAQSDLRFPGDSRTVFGIPRFGLSEFR